MKILLISVSLITSLISSVGYFSLKQKHYTSNNKITYAFTQNEVEKDIQESHSVNEKTETLAQGYHEDVFSKFLEVYPEIK